MGVTTGVPRAGGAAFAIMSGRCPLRIAPVLRTVLPLPVASLNEDVDGSADR